MSKSAVVWWALLLTRTAGEWRQACGLVSDFAFAGVGVLRRAGLSRRQGLGTLEPGGQSALGLEAKR
jgi:hypothetical protein